MEKESIWVDMTPEKGCLPVNTDAHDYSNLTHRDMHIIQIVMNLLRQHRISSSTTNVNVFEEVKKNYYNTEGY